MTIVPTLYTYASTASRCTQRLYENAVEHNISESGVQSLTVNDLVDGDGGGSALLASTRLFDRLRTEYSVLITPGAHFGIGKYIRIGYGYDVDRTMAGLARIDALLADLSDERAKRSERSSGNRRAHRRPSHK